MKPADLAHFGALVRTRAGLVFEGHGTDKLAQALQERMRALDLSHPRDYHLRVMSQPAEFQALINLLTINETYFFREPAQIALLTDIIVPRLLAARSHDRPVTLFCAGCSSGEEPYSLAMALTEKYGSGVARLFRFLAGDIDSNVLERARAGLYGEFSFRGVPQTLRQRYFTAQGPLFCLDPGIRGQVRFFELNLLAERYPPELCDVDVVFFRNVSIYFDEPTRHRILTQLASLMHPDGVLLVGTAETLANDLGVLPLREEGGLFYFSRAGTACLPAQRFAPDWDTPAPPPWLGHDPLPGPAAAPPDEATGPCPPPAPQPAAPATGRPELEAARHLIAERDFDAALPRLESLLGGPHADEARLLKAFALINRKDFAAAAALAADVRTRTPWSIDALLLQGLAAKWQGQADLALRCFKETTYASQACWPAHFYLGELYRQEGDAERARRAYRAVLQCLERQDGDTGLSVVPLGLPAGEIRFLCQHQIERLTAVPSRAGQR